VTVLPNWSWAVTVTLKAVPAVVLAAEDTTSGVVRLMSAAGAEGVPGGRWVTG
jgi:hypothetical protein